MSTRITRSAKKVSTHQASESTLMPAQGQPEKRNVTVPPIPNLVVTRATSAVGKRPKMLAGQRNPDHTKAAPQAEVLAQSHASTATSGQNPCPDNVVASPGSKQGDVSLRMNGMHAMAAITPRNKPRKRASSDLNLNATASPMPERPSQNQVAARAIKKAKRSTGSTPVEESSESTSANMPESDRTPVRKGLPKPRPVSKAKVLDAQGNEAPLVNSSSAIVEVLTSKGARRPPVARKVITDPAAEEANHDDELSDAASGSDLDVEPDDPEVEDGGRDSDSDLEEVEPEELGQQLAAEQPVWIGSDKLQSVALSTMGGKGQARGIHTKNDTPQLDLEDAFESEDSDAELQPELIQRVDEHPVEYEDEPEEGECAEMDNNKMSVDQTGDGNASKADEVRAAVGTRRKAHGKQAKGKKATTASVDGRRALEHPVWKDVTTLSTSPAPLTTSASQRSKQSSAQLHTDPKAHTITNDTTPGPATLLANDAAPLIPEPIPRTAGQSATSKHLPPEAYSVVLPARPGAALSLTAQHPHIQDTCRACFVQSELDLVFDNAFPDGLERTQFVANGLVTAADALGYPGLSRRYQVDEEFFRQVSSIAKQRISTFRGTIKKVAQAHVVAHYTLSPNDCVEKINWMFEDLLYVYPFTYEPPKRHVFWSKPYLHPAIISILRQCFFAGSSSIGFKHPSRFVSSLPERPHEKEIPMPMLALIGTAIHACLMDWKHGSFKSMAFSSDTYLDPYNEHMTLLQGIQNSSARGYHHIAHKLYCIASGVSAKPVAATSSTSAASALAHVDFANMDID